MSGRIQLVLPTAQASTAKPAIDAAVTLATALKAEITATIARTDIDAPVHWLAREYAQSVVADLNAQSATDAEALRAAAVAAGEQAGITVNVAELIVGVGGPERAVVKAARTHDLSVLGVSDRSGEQRRLIEELLFDSGRPVLVTPLSRPFNSCLGTVAIAWDHSEPASRVLSGALPILKQARRVVVLSVLGAKRLPLADAAKEVAAYLSSHGLETTWETLESEDRARGRFIMETAIARGAGLLIMGAYSTPRASEYVLGGVTISVLNEPLLPVLMAN
jgi:nucleotide-binding universal stress UspA family protein